jgi:polysaccharide pyruvyl transferase WcaK-like protein
MPAHTTHIVTIGAALSANKGAASMLRAVLDQVPDTVGPCRITVLTTYPEADRAVLDHPHATIVSATPRQIVFPMLPLALLAWLLRRLRLDPSRVVGKGAVGALVSADIVLDLAGISFSDGRGVALLGYNSLMTGIPILSGAPVLKCSQALGTFTEPLNRFMAKRILGHVAGICARGSKTAENVRGLGLSTPMVEAADLAFLMKVPETDRHHAVELVPKQTPYVVVAPSSVVEAYCQGVGIDYIGLMASVVRRLVADGVRVVVMAHSFRPGGAASRMNDGPVCAAVADRVAGGAMVQLVAGDEAPTTLRAIIEGSELLITSRFHGMISALATSTPVVVLGWSHKYHEVMEAFELADRVMRFEEASEDLLWEWVCDVREHRDDIARTIASHLPQAVLESRRNLDEIKRILG